MRLWILGILSFLTVNFGEALLAWPQVEPERLALSQLGFEMIAPKAATWAPANADAPQYFYISVANASGALTGELSSLIHGRMLRFYNYSRGPWYNRQQFTTYVVQVPANLALLYSRRGFTALTHLWVRISYERISLDGARRSMKESFQHQEVMSLLDGDLRAFPDFLLQANRPFHFLNQRDQMAFAQLATGGVRQKGENSFVIRVNFEVLTSASDNMAAVVVYRSKDVWGPHRVYAGSTESIPPGQMSKMPCDEALKFLK